MYSDAFNAVLWSQQVSDSYYQNMQNRFTPGAVETEVTFQEVYTGYTQAGGSAPKYAVRELNFSQGVIADVSEKKPMALAIDGSGFFVVSDGVRDFYSRNGDFKIKDGALVNQMGLKVKGYAVDEKGEIIDKNKLESIALNFDPQSKLYNAQYTGYRFAEDGTLYGQVVEVDEGTKNSITREVPIYKVAMAAFANPSGLQPKGVTIFSPTENSGPAIAGTAREGAIGFLRPGCLELSNIDPIKQAYKAGQARQANSMSFKVIQAQEEMMKQASQIIR